jgi:hypothetical protein
MNIRPFEWLDRRPIGMINLASHEAVSKTNPRGWFNDPTADFLSDLGIVEFRLRLLETAATAVTELRRINAQGMIVRDPEGCEHATNLGSFIGDPSIIEKLAPEMTGAITEFLQVFREANITTGLCIRPQNFDLQVFQQEFERDPVSVAMVKMLYAKSRWGCRIFYIDSTIENTPHQGTVDLPGSFLATLRNAMPGILLIPEKPLEDSYQNGAPYGRLSDNYLGAPAGITGFGVIDVDGANPQDHLPVLVHAVRTGNILLCNGARRDDPTNQAVIEAYRQARALSQHS